MEQFGFHSQEDKGYNWWFSLSVFNLNQMQTCDPAAVRLKTSRQKLWELSDMWKESTHLRQRGWGQRNYSSYFWIVGVTEEGIPRTGLPGWPLTGRRSWLVIVYAGKLFHNESMMLWRRQRYKTIISDQSGGRTGVWSSCSTKVHLKLSIKQLLQEHLDTLALVSHFWNHSSDVRHQHSVKAICEIATKYNLANLCTSKWNLSCSCDS